VAGQLGRWVFGGVGSNMALRGLSVTVSLLYCCSAADVWAHVAAVTCASTATAVA